MEKIFSKSRFKKLSCIQSKPHNLKKIQYQTRMSIKLTYFLFSQNSFTLRIKQYTLPTDLIPLGFLHQFENPSAYGRGNPHDDGLGDPENSVGLPVVGRVEEVIS